MFICHVNENLNAEPGVPAVLPLRALSRCYANVFITACNCCADSVNNCPLSAWTEKFSITSGAWKPASCMARTQVGT